MAITVTIRPDPKQLRELEAAFDRLSKVGRNPRRILGQIGLYVRREAQRALRSRGREWGPSSGRLSRSLAMRLDSMSVEVGSNLVYAAIQQLGGEVKPKGHKYLAIAVSPELRRRGVWPRDLPRDSMRFVPNAAIRIGTRQWTGPALVRASDQTQHETDESGKRRPIGRRKPEGEVMFALVRRVSIKARPYLTFDSRAQAFALSQIDAEISRAIRGG